MIETAAIGPGDLVFAVLVAGSFVAAALSAAFSVGGAMIILAVTTTVLPVAAVVPLHSTLLIGSTAFRTVLFRRYIVWSLAWPFMIGALAGAFIGARLYVELPERLIAAALAIVMIVSIWLPRISWRPAIPSPWAVVGFLHSFISTLFAYGAILQAVIIHTRLGRHAVIATTAAALFGMSVFKIVGYVVVGFDYSPYLPGYCLLAGSRGGRHLGRPAVHRANFRTAVSQCLSAAYHAHRAGACCTSTSRRRNSLAVDFGQRRISHNTPVRTTLITIPVTSGK